VYARATFTNCGSRICALITYIDVRVIFSFSLKYWLNAKKHRFNVDYNFADRTTGEIITRCLYTRTHVPCAYGKVFAVEVELVPPFSSVLAFNAATDSTDSVLTVACCSELLRSCGASVACCVQSDCLVQSYRSYGSCASYVIQDGICGTGRPQQNMGIIALRVTPYSTGRDHRQHGDRGQSAESAQRTHVPHLPGYAEKDHDHQGVPPPFLFRLYYYSFTKR